MRSKEEAKFYARIKNYYQDRKDVYLYKIPDSIPSPEARFNPKKPYDIILAKTVEALVNNHTEQLKRNYCIELKVHKSGAFPFDKVKEHQEAGLDHAKARGNKAYVLILLKESDKIIPIEIDSYFILKDRYMGQYDRKSVPQAELVKLFKGFRIKDLDTIFT